MQRSTFTLSRRFKAAVYISFGLLLLTGAGWMRAQSHLGDDAWERVPRFLLTIHGGAAMGALLVLGALTKHVQRGWSARRNRVSGALLLGLNAFLIVTGYGLYYCAAEDLRAWLSQWHAWIGLGTGILLPAHIVVGRLIRRRLPGRQSGVK